MRLPCLCFVAAMALGACSGSGGSSPAGGGGGHGGRSGSGGGASATGGTGGAFTGAGGAGMGGRGGNGGTASSNGGSLGSGGHGATGGASAGSGGAGGKVAAGGGGAGGGHGGSGVVCGGLLGRGCDTDQFCLFRDGSCGAGDQTGTCQPRQVGGVACAPGPVCGCDGKSYPNACTAHQAGTDTTATNGCITGSGAAGAPCGADSDCATGLKCCPTGGNVGSPIACRQVTAGSQCPALP